MAAILIRNRLPSFVSVAYSPCTINKNLLKSSLYSTKQDGQCGTQYNATIVSSLHQSSSVLNIEDHCGGCFDIVVPAISPNLSYVNPRQESIVEKPSTIYAAFVLPSHLVSTLIDYRLSIGTWQANSTDFQTVILRL